jgi:hypothetical protein
MRKVSSATLSPYPPEFCISDATKKGNPVFSTKSFPHVQYRKRSHNKDPEREANRDSESSISFPSSERRHVEISNVLHQNLAKTLNVVNLKGKRNERLNGGRRKRQCRKCLGIRKCLSIRKCLGIRKWQLWRKQYSRKGRRKGKVRRRKSWRRKGEVWGREFTLWVCCHDTKATFLHSRFLKNHFVD